MRRSTLARTPAAGPYPSHTAARPGRYEGMRDGEGHNVLFLTFRAVEGQQRTRARVSDVVRRSGPRERGRERAEPARQKQRRVSPTASRRSGRSPPSGRTLKQRPPRPVVPPRAVQRCHIRGSKGVSANTSASTSALSSRVSRFGGSGCSERADRRQHPSTKPPFEARTRTQNRLSPPARCHARPQPGPSCHTPYTPPRGPCHALAIHGPHPPPTTAAEPRSSVRLGSLDPTRPTVL
ncbi:hypothetical protein QF037_010144 [Streptomyces canus]|nr:hypothetical protein [Streptomyces canus]